MTTLACSPRFQLDDNARVLVGFIAQVADAVDQLVRHQVGNTRDEGGAIDVIGDLSDDDLFTAALSSSMWALRALDDAFCRF